MKRFQEAEELLKRAAESTPYRAEVHYNLGVLYYRLEQDARSIEFFGRAVKIDPAYDLARYGLARALQASGDLEGARRQVEIILETSGNPELTGQARSLLGELGG
jgi:FimV-like protein